MPVRQPGANSSAGTVAVQLPAGRRDNRRMPTALVSDTELHYTVHGDGQPVLLISPAATSSEVWLGHQVPALRRAGYQPITFDNRGTPPSRVPPGPYRIADFVADTIDLISGLGIAPCPIIGASLGAMVAQELALARPDLVTSLVLLGTRARTDYFRATMSRAQAERIADETVPHSDYDAVGSLLRLLSPRTLADDRLAADWFAVARTFPVRGEGAVHQYAATVIDDRRRALEGLGCPCLVVGFADDVLTPPEFGREVASIVRRGQYVEFDGCGHFGFLERPDAVNDAVIDFLYDDAVGDVRRVS